MHLEVRMPNGAGRATPWMNDHGGNLYSSLDITAALHLSK